MAGSSAYVLTGGSYLAGDATLRRGQVVVCAGRIDAVLAHDAPTPGGLEVIDATGCLISPGMVDVMLHGMHEHAFVSGSPDDIVAVARILATTGVTGFLPALYALPLAQVEEKIASMRPAFEQDTGGAVPLGIHMEGPFFKRAGAHKAEYLRVPDPETIEHLLASADGLVKMITLSPEIENGIPAIRHCAGGHV